MTFLAFEPERRIARHIWRRTFLTPLRSLSVGWPTMGVKAFMAASNLAEMSDDEVIVAWGLD